MAETIEKSRKSEKPEVDQQIEKMNLLTPEIEAAKPVKPLQNGDIKVESKEVNGQDMTNNLQGNPNKSVHFKNYVRCLAKNKTYILVISGNFFFK